MGGQLCAGYNNQEQIEKARAKVDSCGEGQHAHVLENVRLYEDEGKSPKATLWHGCTA